MSTSTPQIDSTLPETPSDEWAHKTTSALKLPPPSNSNMAEQLPVSTPGFDIPGAYPGDATPSPSIYSQALSDSDSASVATRGAKDTLHHTAEAYIATERLDKVEHLVEGVGSKAAQYVPAGVASAVSSYWYGTRQSASSDATSTTASAADADTLSGKGKGKALDRSQSREKIEKEKEREREKAVESEKEEKGKGKEKAPTPPPAEPKLEPTTTAEKAPTPVPAQPKLEPITAAEKAPTPVPAEPKLEPTTTATSDPAPPVVVSSQNTQAPPYPTQPATVPTADSIDPHGGDGGDGASPAAAPAPVVSDPANIIGGNGIGYVVSDDPVSPPAGAVDPKPTPTDNVSESLPTTSAPAPVTDIPPKDPVPTQSDGAVPPATEAPTVIEPTDPIDGGSAGQGEYSVAKEKEKEKAVEEGKTGHDTPTPTPTPAPVSVPVPFPAPPTTPSKPALRGDGQYHPALLHPMNSSYSSSTVVSPPAKSPPGSIKSKKEADKDKEKHGHGHHSFSFAHRHKRTSSIASASSVSTQGGGRRKVGFFDKVKGETKVIIGKIEHKPEKVEEGKRILRGED